MKLKIGVSIVLLSASAAIFLCVKDAFAHYEEPDFSTIKKEGKIELRDYPSVIAASVEMGGSGAKADDQAFSILAGYIFGKNKSKQKIAMTVPVTEEKSEKIAMTVPVTSELHDGSMKMTFYLPSKYQMDELPDPEDSRIKFERIPAGKYAAIQFSGLFDERNFQKHLEALQEYIATNNLKAAAQPVRAFYNPPWTLPFLRRNEIWIELAD